MEYIAIKLYGQGAGILLSTQAFIPTPHRVLRRRVWDLRRVRSQA